MTSEMTKPGLVAHWPLTVDTRDHSGHDHHGAPHNVVCGVDGAVFNGKDSVIEIANARGLELGTGDFTVAAWIHADAHVADTIGDIMSKYDGEARRGFSLTVKDNPAGPHNTPNVRNVHFGIDAGTEPQWSICGRPGNSRVVQAFAVHEGNLYAGTHETDFDQRGHVFRYEDGERWTDMGAPDARNIVYSLASLAGELYATTACDDLAGSLCSPAKNLTPGGSAYRLARDGSWVDLGNPFPSGRTTLAVCGGRLYAKNIYHPGVYRHEGDRNWVLLQSPNVAITSLAAFNGHLYATPKALKVDIHPNVVHPNPHHTAYRYDEAAGWHGCGKRLRGQIYGFAIHRGEIFAGTWPRGSTYRSHTGCDDWIDCGACGCAPLEGEIKGEIMGMATYNGKLYVGTLPLAEVFRYDGDNRWTHLKRLDLTPDAQIRRAWSMAEYGGRLFVGVLPSGEVQAMEAGRNAMSDRELGPGWKHVAAVRSEGKLQLYIDCVLAVSSSPFKPTDFDLQTKSPLQIGFGPHDHFCGRMRDVRLYNRALDAHELLR